jgi:transcriptional regulator with XRE-family HTH domain
MDGLQESRQEFGARVRRYRELRGWDMEELAARLGKSQATISRIETGKQNVAVGDIKAIARVLDILPSALLDDPETEKADVAELFKKSVVERCTKKSQAALHMLHELVQEFEKISV